MFNISPGWRGTIRMTRASVRTAARARRAPSAASSADIGALPAFPTSRAAPLGSTVVKVAALISTGSNGGAFSISRG